MSETSEKKMHELFNSTDANYLVIFNKFEITTPKTFSNKTSFSIHIDIYDRSLNKIYGGKSSWKRRITKEMHHSTMEYYISSMLEYYFSKFDELKNLSD